MQEYKICADSSADVLKLNKVTFGLASLTIVTKEKEYKDDENLDVEEMVKHLANYNEKSSTACPSVQEWLDAFGDAKNIFAIAITSALSGSFNSLNLAKNIFLEKYPDRKVHIIDSLSTGPKMRLIIYKLEELILKGLSFEDIIEEITKYQKSTEIIFMLESMNNLANNGRVNKLVAKAVGLLNIKIIGKASEQGTLEVTDKKRGSRSVINCIIDKLGKLKYNGKKILIGHCFNYDFANIIKNKILEIYKYAEIELYALRGLCSFYAEKGGLIIGFEQA
ncbi:MAG: DegV family protein [Anaeroplasma sp.]